MRVVVDLDPLGRRIQREGLGKPVQQARLGRRLAHLAGKAFAGIARGERHELGLLPPQWHDQFHLAPALFAQGLGHEIRVLDRVGQQDLAGRVLLVVELAKEGLQHLGLFRAGAGAWVEIAVAPVLVRADEEDLHAGLAALHVERNDIGLGHASRVDTLDTLNGCQRTYAVPQGCGPFELHRVGGRLHFRGKLFLDPGAIAGQEPLGILHGGRVILLGNQPDTGARAALDLVEQAGPGPAVESRVGTVAQQKDLLQLVQRPVYRIGAGEGSVVVALLLLRAPMLLDLREGMGTADQDIGEALVIAQQNVVARLQLLDQVLFQQQRLGFRARGQEHHLGRFADHPGDPRAVARGFGVV